LGKGGQVDWRVHNPKRGSSPQETPRREPSLTFVRASSSSSLGGVHVQKMLPMKGAPELRKEEPSRPPGYDSVASWGGLPKPLPHPSTIGRSEEDGSSQSVHREMDPDDMARREESETAFFKCPRQTETGVQALHWVTAHGARNAKARASVASQRGPTLRSLGGLSPCMQASSDGRPCFGDCGRALCPQAQNSLDPPVRAAAARPDAKALRDTQT
jgi:hypothetical protein